MKLLQAFRNRHPVCAALIGFFVAPTVMMAYLGRWKRVPDTAEFVVPDGHYFVLGDNRDQSDDSRYEGFIPEDNIFGKVVLVLPHDASGFGAYRWLN